MNIDTLLIYTAVSFFYIISPGPAIFLAISNGISAGHKAVVLSSLGNILGLLLLSLVSIFGLGTIILASSLLFLIVKILGAIYLLYLGVKQFKASKELSKLSKSKNEQLDKSNSLYFSEGFLLAATNPKPILFFISIFPQFLDVKSAIVSQFFTLTLIFMLISFSSLFCYGVLAKSAKHILKSGVRAMWFHRITGGIFIAMGLMLLQLRRVSN